MRKREEEIRIRLQRMSGRRHIGEFRRRVHSSTNLQLGDYKFIVLEKTLALLEQLSSKIAALENQKAFIVQYFSTSREAANFVAKINFRNQSNDDEWYVCHSRAQELGALVMKRVDFLENSLGLLEADQDSVCAFSNELDRGVLLDYFEEQRNWIYEVRIWGDLNKNNSDT